MLLAGDIGATKTTLAVFSPDKGPRHPLAEATFPSQDYRSLEVIASLLLQLDRRKIAVGFVTNGCVSGAGNGVVSISSHPHQTATILEALARVGAASAGPLTGILSAGYRIPGGVSSICFALSSSGKTLAAEAYMKHRCAAIQFVLAQKPPYGETPEVEHRRRTVYLEDLRLSAGERKR